MYESRSNKEADMLQLLVCSDVHTYTDNIRLALEKTDRTDAILIAGDLEAEEAEVLKAAGDVPCYCVCGNNDYYLNTEYPEELLIDISSASACSSPSIQSVTSVSYTTVPERYRSLPSFLQKGLFSGLAASISSQKRPPEISHRILMTHGKEYDVPDTRLLALRAAQWDADLVIYGHTHRFADTTENRGKCRLINPGCLVGDPRASVRVFANYEICSYSLLRVGLEGEISVQHLYL